VNVEINITSEELKTRKVMVATPMYGGQCAGIYTKSSTDLAMAAKSYGVPLSFFYLFNESLITRARNYLVDEFMRSDFTHLMFIDSDIGFDPNDVLALAAIADPNSDKEIVCGPYPKKAIAWEKIKKAVDKGFADQDPKVLEKYVGDYVFNPVGGAGDIRIDQPAEVLEGGTGFMMIQRSAFEKYAAAYPEFSYKPDHIRTENFDGSREIMAYFDCVICPESKRYLSEDYMFCQWARKAGIKVWMCPWMKLTHMGSYMFGGSLADLAQLGASATVGPDFQRHGANPKKVGPSSIAGTKAGIGTGSKGPKKKRKKN
tara:strand:- start:2482 stop:3426 length:945 start_codon:yes stop_codon:yes gene_type:complete